MSNYNQIKFALKILQELAEKPLSRKELEETLISFLEQEKQPCTDVSQRISRTIGKLRDCGIKIKSSTRSPYELVESNFPVILSHQQKEALCLASNLLSNMGFLQQAQQLATIIDFSKHLKLLNLKTDFYPPVDYSSGTIVNTIRELEKRIEQGCRYTIRYYSQSKKTEQMYDLDRSELRLHNGVVYLFAFVPDWKFYHFNKSCNIDQNVLFHIKRITAVGPSSDTRWFYNFPTLTIRYRMIGSLANYQPRRFNEKVINRLEKKYVDIETTEDCLFWFKQRFLQYSYNALILEPDWLRQEIKNDLKKSYENYTNF